MVFNFKQIYGFLHKRQGLSSTQKRRGQGNVFYKVVIKQTAARNFFELLFFISFESCAK